MDELALVSAAKAGDLPAFNKLVLNYQSLAYNVAFRIVGDQDTAADATQDAFIKAYKALDGFRGQSFKPWLMRIVTNTCYDQLRAKKRKPTTNLEDALVSPEHSWRLRDPAESPEDHAQRVELGRALQRAIEQLPPEQRTVVVLSDIEGFTYEEIAEATETSLGTVKSRLSRARAKLRDYLQEQEELLPHRYRLRDTEGT